MGLVIAAAERSKVTSPLSDARPRSVITVPVAECVVFFLCPQQTSPIDKHTSPNCSTTGCQLFVFFFPPLRGSGE